MPLSVFKYLDLMTLEHSEQFKAASIDGRRVRTRNIFFMFFPSSYQKTGKSG
jgi:hypothetical protein